MDKNRISTIKTIFLIAFLALVILNFTNILNNLGLLLEVLSPIMMGCVIAFVLNTIVTPIEDKLLSRIDNRFMNKIKRMLSIVLALLISFSLIFLIMKLIVPEVKNSLATFVVQLPDIYEIVKKEIIKIIPSAQENLSSTNLNVQEIANKAFETVSAWAGGIFSLVNSVFGVLASVVMASILAIYIVSSKETLTRQFDKLFKKFVPERIIKPMYYFFDVSNSTFKAFFTGQFIEAIILGVLCTLGMAALRLPYASMVGSFVGLTALVPMVGAYLGCLFGFLMLLPVSPFKAMVFIIFLLVLQQIEGNVIYPRVVGSSVGLPGMWVLVSVIVGGGLFNMVGIFFGVPVTAVIYKILKDQVNSGSTKIADRVENFIEDMTKDPNDDGDCDCSTICQNLDPKLEVLTNQENKHDVNIEIENLSINKDQ